jgi:hypothetical protein
MQETSVDEILKQYEEMPVGENQDEGVNLEKVEEA